MYQPRVYEQGKHRGHIVNLSEEIRKNFTKEVKLSGVLDIIMSQIGIYQADKGKCRGIPARRVYEGKRHESVWYGLGVRSNSPQQVGVGNEEKDG